MSGEAGLTLVEMMITVSILVVVLLATFALLDTSRKASNREEQRSDSIREAQSGLLRMAKDLRAAYAVNSLSSNSMTVFVRCKSVTDGCAGATLTNPGTRMITYTCTTSCLRGESTTLDGTGNCCTAPTVNVPIIKRVQNQLNGATAWDCPYVAADSATAGPIFSYKIRQPFANPPTLTPSCTPGSSTPPNEVDLTIQVPAAGEKPNGGYKRSIILRDAIYLRNLDV
jgi:Tfp pilus assembly protein PilV